MTLEQAIELVHIRKAKWVKNRSSTIEDYIWYVITFNNEFAIVDKSEMNRKPELMDKVVYDTNIGIYRL